MRVAPRTAIAIVLLAVLAPAGVPAQDKPPPRLVTRDELRVCMNSEGELAGRRRAMDARGKQNQDEQDAIRAEAQELQQEHQRLEDANANRDRFERRVKAHNARVATANSAAAAFRAELEALNKALIAHNEQCGGISFRSEDKEAILKERESATK
jgi:hypothetical protein